MTLILLDSELDQPTTGSYSIGGVLSVIVVFPLSLSDMFQHVLSVIIVFPLVGDDVTNKQKSKQIKLSFETIKKILIDPESP